MFTSESIAVLDESTMTTVHPIPAQETDAIPPDLEDILQQCLRMRPDLAARRRDSSLCVTPLIQELIMDGKRYSLRLVQGKWAAIIVRVSSEKQRSRPSTTDMPMTNTAPAGAKLPLMPMPSKNERKKPRRKDDGYSEEDQIRRGIRHCVAKGWAFKIYSDCGVTGEYPNDDPALIQKLLDKKADRFHRIFTAVMLDSESVQRRSAEDTKALICFRDQRAAKIRASVTRPTADDGLSTDSGSDDGGEVVKSPAGRPRRGRPTLTAAYFRQGFTQMWKDAEAGLVHIVAASDRSRIARDADLENALLKMLDRHGVDMQGTIEDMSQIDVSDPVLCGVQYLLASVNEKRIFETTRDCFRGKVQHVESGRPLNTLPWWVRRTKDGFAEVVPGCDDLVKRIINLYLQGYGVKAITSKLRDEGVSVSGHVLSESQVRGATLSDSVTGYLTCWGLRWKLLPAVVEDDDLLTELRSTLAERRDEYGFILDYEKWSDHLFTGLIYCKCGKTMGHFNYRGIDGPNSIDGRLVCRAKNKKVNGQARFTHACLPEKQLSQFVAELFRDNPRIMTGALARSLSGDSPATRAAQRALLEERLQQLTDAMKAHTVEARGKSEASAAAFGLQRGTAAFDNAVDALAAGMLEPCQREVETARADLTKLQIACSGDKRSEAIASALSDLQGWDDLDNATRHRLMGSIFSRIEVYPRMEENCVVFHLAGIDSPLKPVYLGMAPYRNVVFPTVAEWLAQPVDPLGRIQRQIQEPLLNTHNTPSFYVFLRRAKKEGPDAQEIIARLGASTPPRKSNCKKASAAAAVSAGGATEALMGAFERLWAEHEDCARQRLVDARSHAAEATAT